MRKAKEKGSVDGGENENEEEKQPQSSFLYRGVSHRLAGLRSPCFRCGDEGSARLRVSLKGERDLELLLKPYFKKS